MIHKQLELIHADSLLKRACGLLFKAKLKSNEIIWLRSCNAIHTVGMRYSISLFYLNSHHKVIDLIQEIKPFSFSANPRAESVVETLAYTELTAEDIESTIELFLGSR